jgi:hypothetical protein
MQVYAQRFHALRAPPFADSRIISATVARTTGLAADARHVTGGCAGIGADVRRIMRLASSSAQCISWSSNTFMFLTLRDWA